MSYAKEIADLISHAAKEVGKVEGLNATQVGAFAASNNVGETQSAIYVMAYAKGMRPTDLERVKNKISTATDASYKGWQQAAELIAWTDKERAIWNGPTPLKSDKSKKAEALRDARSTISDKKSSALRTFKRGLTTQDKAANPEAYKKGPTEKKTPFEQLSAHIQNALNVVQGDKTLPDNCKADEIASILLAMQKVHKLDTGKPIDIDSIP